MTYLHTKVATPGRPNAIRKRIYTAYLNFCCGPMLKGLGLECLGLGLER